MKNLGKRKSFRPIVALLREDMLEFAENPKEVKILDENGNEILAGDNDRRFLKLLGFINTTENIISRIQQAIRILFVMPLATIRMGHLHIRVGF